MKRTLIIAEAGVNHNGDINIAKKLVDAAADAGVDYVKFQTFKADKLVNKDAKQADYQIENTGVVESQYQMLKRLELTDENHHILIDYCDKKGVKFLSTAFDFESIEFLKDKLDFYKIPSGEITNLPYLIKVAKLKLPIVMSTGMANMQEVKEALAVLIAHGINKEDVTILHCNTEYPTPMKDVNLLAMKTIEKELGVEIGYSDHTLGIEIPIAAVTLGATVIEKHFTIDKTMEGPDHKASLEPNELKAMVAGIRAIELAMGNGIKTPSESEQKNIKVARKSLVALTDIKEGEVFNESNITVKRPGTGISPMKWNEVLGSRASRNYKADELL
ncbi:N-acetylneuraminate synthase [Flavobacteriales bacterium]|jgi:N,N'-diacetyllegionaminate synthase|nr:N-acetylneuraminate synthase [Flavobacteriales bacterium]MDA9775754.1 N-acetylneuraminate synthase [Flavobacteriales bacterium]MDB9702037.1 N-acetylneuraminate synthase [Flavobacteriales bacterium]MDB9931544.1 N-acetylneuraminate synthase [Flavobacteriales bacterium]MDC1370567.1 N-acetylneuraminate synthase [Flavobacteriales bacterium]|tara:strand:+ start:1747 stop:2742 length:996 start_codon:yes stop_codon:yes gene_type:complete